MIPIPGPSAVAAALSVAGLPTDRFLFLGFLPHKKGRETLIKQIIESKYTIVFYESVHRIIKTIDQLKKFGLERQVVVCRELTKMFEEVVRGDIEEVLKHFEGKEPKGEFVVVIEGK